MKILLIALLLAAACATSQPPAATADAPSDYWSQPPPGEDPLICEERMETGSHIPTKTCHKKSALDAKRASTQSQLLTPKAKTER